MPDGQPSNNSGGWGGSLDAFRLVLRWRRAFAATVFTVIALVAIGTLLATPIYESRVRILISDDQAQQLDPARFYQPIDREFCQTQAEILKSRPIAEQVVKQLKLDQREEPRTVLSWIAGPLIGLKNWFSSAMSGGAGPDKKLSEYFQFQEVVGELRDQISILLVRNATVIDVAVLDWDRKMAQKIADALAEIFVIRVRDLKRDDSHQANTYLTERLAETSRKLIESEKALRQFEDQHQAAHLDAQIKHLMESRLLSVDDELALTEKSLAEEKSRVEVLATQLKAQYGKLMTGQQAGLISQAKIQMMEKEAALAQLQQSYTPNHPEVQKLQIELESIRRAIAAEQKMQHSGQGQATDRVTESLEVAHTNAQQTLRVQSTRKEVLTKQKAEVSAQIKHFLTLSTQHALLSRELEANKKVHEIVLMRQKEAALKEATTGAPARVIEGASIPRLPARPRKLLNLLIGVALGTLCGFLMVHLLEYRDTTLKTRTEIAHIVRVPILGTLIAKVNRRMTDAQIERAVQTMPTSIVAEGFRSLRTSLRHVLPSHVHSVLLVTSSQASKGKTTVVCNLALALAQSGESVLMIDCDLRRPRLEKVFDLEGRKGVCDLGKAPLESLIYPTTQANLSLMPAGKGIDDPATFLEGPTLRGLLPELRRRYNWVLLDSPPVNVVSDSLTLVPQVDGTLLVVCAEEVTRSSLEISMERLNNVRATLVGVVINNLKTGDAQAYGYYGYYRTDDQPKVKPDQRKAG